MNLYAFLPLVALCANVILGSYILYRNPKNKSNILYSLFAFMMAVWAFGTFLVFTSTTAEAAFQSNKILELGSSIFPAPLLHFFLVFTKNKLASKKIYYIPLYLPALFFVFVNLTTNLVTVGMKASWWGYSPVSGILSIPFTFYVIGYFVAGVFFCYRFYSRTPSGKEKIQAKFLLTAIIIPLLGGVVTEVIPPLVGFEMVPLSTLFITVSVLIIAYTIIKYRLMTPVSSSIQRELTATFLSLIMLVGIFISLSATFITKDIVELQIKNGLESVAHSRANHVEDFFGEHRESIGIMLSSNPIKDFLSTSRDDPEYDSKLENAKERIIEVIEFEKDILRVSLIDRTGIVVLSSDESSIHMEESEVLSALKEKNVSFKDAHWCGGFNVACVDFALPIFDGNGQLLGGVIFDMGLNSLYDITTDRTGLGESGEIYIVNKDGYMITPSRFREDTFLKQKADTQNVKNCFSMREDLREHAGHESITVFPDYRGVNVLGTHVYMPEMEWCLLAETDENEAFAPLLNLQNSMISIIVIVAILGTIFSFAFSRSLTKPLVRLRDTAKEIGRGKLYTKIEVGSRDEIGQLASAFSQMTKDLKKSQEKIRMHAEELERNVKERTKELDKKVKELTVTKTAVLNMMEDTDQTNKELMRTQDELRKSLKELKEMDIKKNQFISIAAHELKTPLTSIHGFSQLLQDRKVANNFTKRNKYLKIMDHETKRLAKLVSDMLDLSRIDLGMLKPDLGEVDIKELMKSVRREMDVAIKEKGLESEYDFNKGLPRITTDREKLTEIMINLISNAVKYTQKGKITVKAFRENEDVLIVVKDTGIGIAEEQQEKIFGRFYQVDSSYTRKAGGTGLGLSLCKEFLYVLGGKIWVKSEPGKGSEFHFTLPIKGVTKVRAHEEEIRAKEALKKSEELRKRSEKLF